MAFIIGLFIFFIFLFVIWVVIHNILTPRISTFTLFFGPPGCGKTMFLTKVACKYYKKRPIYTNYKLRLPGVCRFQKRDIGSYSFPVNSIMLFDEGSLNGFDNRNFKTNFKDPNMLEYFKLARHYRNSFVFSNQGWDELDLKIRTITSYYYLVRRLPIFSMAIRVTASVGVDKDTRQIVDFYKIPSLFRIIFDPHSVYLVRRSKYGALYNSWEKPDLPEINKERWINNDITA